MDPGQFHRVPTNDPRWIYSEPAIRQPYFMWLQHALAMLSARGRAVLLLPDGSTKGQHKGSHHLRRRLVEGDLLAAVVTLPPGVFPHARVGATVWLLAKDKSPQPHWGHSDRRKTVLFLDARGVAVGRSGLDDHDADRLGQIAAAWCGEDGTDSFAEVPGACAAIDAQTIAANDFVLAPSRYLRTPPPTEQLVAPDHRPPTHAALHTHWERTTILDSRLTDLLEGR